MRAYSLRRHVLVSVELAPPQGSLSNAALRVGLWLVRCIERSRQRARLAELDDRALDDIGITRADAQREAAKPFWM